MKAIRSMQCGLSRLCQWFYTISNASTKHCYVLIHTGINFNRRSQRPCGLRHVLSSLARTLGSWVRIPLTAWMSVCVYSVCVVLCVGSGLATDWSPVQGVLQTVYRLKKQKNKNRGQGPTKGCRAIIIVKKKKGKAIPVTGRGGPWGCEKSRLPHFL
jgi:hypothetical protein